MSMDERQARLQRDRDRMIAKTGWNVTGVFPTDDTPPGEYDGSFAYTIGLGISYGHPELLMMGLPLRTMGDLLNILGLRVREGERIEVGVPLRGTMHNNVPLLAVPVLSSNWMPWINQAINHYAFHQRPWDLRVLQILWPDAKGRFPTDPRFDPRYSGRQVLLNERQSEDERG